MPSALASQLAKGVSLNSPLLSETARKKHFASSSYLFSPSTKGQIDDLDTIHALALNALSQLRQVYPSIAVVDEQFQVHRALFSHRAKETDRTLLVKDDLAELNAAIKSCLAALGPCLMENAAGRVIEWLVRRFRVNEFNVPDVLALFFPYHESPHFAKMVSILTIDENATWRFMAAYKATGKPVQRSTLVTEMLKDRELARLIASLLPEALATSGGGNTHRTLICFNTSVVLEYVTRADKRDLDAATLAFLLPFLTEPLKLNDFSIAAALRKDSILGSFVLLAALSQKCTFTMPAVKTIMSGMVHCASATSLVGAYQLLTALISFLGPQRLLGDVSAKVVDELVPLSDFPAALRSSLEWAGVEKLVVPILGSLVENASAENYAVVVQLLISSKNTSKDILQHMAEKILLRNGESELLPELYQRHPDVLRSAVDGLVAGDEGKRAELEEKLINLASTGGSEKVPQDVILASSNADPSVRASAIRHITQLLTESAEAMGDNERSYLQEALLARIYDTDAVVLDALYSNPTVLVPLLASYPDVISKLATSLASQKASRSVLRAHLTFFCNAFVDSHPEQSLRVALTLVFPNALFSKPRSKTAAAVWEVVDRSRLGEGKFFKGTKEIVESSGDQMAETNDALTKRLAENFIASNDYPELLSWLLENTSSANDVNSRLFALLVVHSLLKSLSGENRIDAALKFVHTIDVPNMGGLDKLEDGTALDEKAALKSVVLKPSSRTTILRLQFLILTSIAVMPHPQNGEFEWFLSEKNDKDDTVSTRYLRLQRTVYTILNTVTTSANLAIHTNSTLFDTFGSDSLLFLASVWTSAPAITGIDQETTRYIALRHASAFFRAQSTEQPIDFQVVLPSLIASLQASDKRIRVAAMECISTMASWSAGSKPSSIYAYDQAYGPTSAGLQYLDWSDEAKYLKLLVEYQDHLVNDADYLVLFHYEHLSRAKAENKKEAKQRHRVLCFLLSHVLCCPSLSVKFAILKFVNRVSNIVKFQMLLPIIEKALEHPLAIGQEQELEIYALQSFDSSAAKELNAEGSNAWSVLMRSIEYYLAGGNATEHWKNFRASIQDSLFSALSSQRQLEMSLKLIELGTIIGDEASIKPLLTKCIKKPALIIALLQSLQPDVEGTTERAFKRAKTDEPSDDSENLWLPRLSFLAEVLSAQKSPGSPELVIALLDTLSRIASSTAARSDVIYVQQLLMTCLESVVSQIHVTYSLLKSPDSQKLELVSHRSNVIRADVLVELMRASENPQSFNQALLLLASLARLSPTSVLNNVMPIFTFMGSNVFHRDDSYSFKVIQRTTESIVPVAVDSLKEKYDNNLDLYIGSRDLLRTFTDAYTHVPRHRRTSFFTHLVDVLNPEDYLAPVLMLLADKSANRVSRQDKQEAQATLGLPLGIIQHYSLKMQLSAIKEVIKESQRLTRIVDDTKSQEKVFLEDAAFDEHAVSRSTYRKRQCQTLLILAGFGVKQTSVAKLAKSPTDDLELIITTLTELATLDHNEQISSDLREVGNSAHWSVLQSMTVVSAHYFTSTILSMLSSENRKIYQSAFTLLATRVPEMKSDTREEISPIMAQIVKRMGELVPSFSNAEIISRAMEALLSIGGSSRSKEESALTGMVTVVIGIIKKHPGMSQAIATIPILTTRLGPRIIPFLRALIDTCVSIMKLSDETINHGVLRSFTSLMKTIPTFWGTQEIKRVVDLYLEEELIVTKDLSTHLGKLVKLLAKQLPSKVVLASLLQSWPSNDESLNHVGSFVRFFELLKWCLHFAARSDVLESLRGLFSYFLQAFEIRGVLRSDEASTVEDKVIAAYLELVVKLNETAFQPLFRKLVDWAFSDTSTSDKQITFWRHYSALLDLFKELMSPYMSLIVNHFAELLNSFQEAESVNSELWLAAIENLTKSFVADDGVYWRDDRLSLVLEPLTQQIHVCVNLKITAGRTLLSDCLNALIDCLEDESSIKAVNLAVLMHTRSGDARIRIFALQCSVAMWQARGSKLRAFESETATFIIECAEDENDDVVRICRQLKDAVQAEVGRIEGL